MKKIAILQSNYIPWKGYFDLIAAVDEFIIYDDVQFTKNDWRNRNMIKTPRGAEWLSIPVGRDIKRRIRDVAVPQAKWQTEHWRSIEANYCKSQHFDEIRVWLEPLYLGEHHSNLSSLNRKFIESVCRYLGIKTVISNSWDYNLTEGKTERLVSLCAQSSAQEYISGPSAKNYIEEKMFTERGIKLTWFDYCNYPTYPQLWGEFIHNVTILDLLFNCGSKSIRYMRYVNP